MSQLPAGPPNTPPEYDVDLFAPLPMWPKVVGILSIVFGSLGITCTGCGVASMVVFMPMLEKQAGEPLPPPQQPDALLWALTGVGAAMAVLLLVSGIVTVLRRPEGRTLHLLYALVDVPLALTGTALQIHRLNEMAQWAANNPDSMWAKQFHAPGGNIGPWLGLTLGVIFGLAYPIFLLVWFGLVKRRPEDMTGTAPPPSV